MAVDAKLDITRTRRWKPGMWRMNLEEIRSAWMATMPAWIDDDRLPDVEEVIAAVAVQLQRLRLD